MNNCTILVNRTISVALATSYSVVMLVGLPLNAFSLWIILIRHGLKSSNLLFMANLALSDFALALSLPLRIHYYATATWPFGDFACTTTTILFRVNMCTSAAFITFISVDRLLAVVFPLRSRMLRTSRSSGITCAVTWLLFIVINIPTAIDPVKKTTDCSGDVCFEYAKNLQQSGLIASLFIFALIVVNVVSTAMTVRTLHGLTSDSIRSDKKRIMLIFGLNLFMFAAFLLPLSIVLLIMSKITDINKVFLKWTVCYANFSLCLDPLIYYFSIDAFWKGKGEHTLDT